MADAIQQLRPKRYGLGVGGLALLTTGGCLMWTIVLIPLALPLALIGLLMAIGSLFVKTDQVACPACQAVSNVEREVTVIKCPQCDTPIRRAEGGWVRVS